MHSKADQAIHESNHSGCFLQIGNNGLCLLYIKLNADFGVGNRRAPYTKRRFTDALNRERWPFNQFGYFLFSSLLCVGRCRCAAPMGIQSPPSSSYAPLRRIKKAVNMRMLIRMHKRKGRKDRYTLLSQTILNELRYQPPKWLPLNCRDSVTKGSFENVYVFI